MNKFRILVALSFLLASLVVGPQVSSAENTQTYTYEISVKLKKKLTTQQIKKQLKRNGLILKKKLKKRVFQVETTEKIDFPKFVIAAKPLTHNIYLSSEIGTKGPPEGPAKGIQTKTIDPCPSEPNPVRCDGFSSDVGGSWAFSPAKGMAVNEAWKQSKGENVIVAVLSTGVNLTHPDLVNNLWSDPATTFSPGESVHGFNSYANTAPTDASGTGTAFAGIVAATANNNIGSAGVAPNAKIMVVKGYDEQNLVREKVYASLNYILKKKLEGNNIRVVLAPNFYLGDAPNLDPTFVTIRDQLKNQGVLIVSGVPYFNASSTFNIDNQVDGYKYFPIHYNTGNILVVASYSHGDFNTSLPAPEYLNQQNIGPNTIHLSAPGYLVYTLDDDGGSVYFSGRGVGAANAAGAAALLFSKVPSLTPGQVIDALVNNVRPYPASFSGKTISQGVLDVGRAMESVSPSYLPGDYNRSGCIEGGDFLEWQRNFGSVVTPGASADGNRDGRVDAADYTVLRDNYGACL